MAPSGARRSASRQNASLSPSFSGMASITTSTSSASSSFVVKVTRASAASASARVSLPRSTALPTPKRPVAMVVRARSRAVESTSYDSTVCPATASTCAMPDPMTPLPMTPIRSVLMPARRPARRDALLLAGFYQSGRSGIPLLPPSGRTASTWCTWISLAANARAEPAM